MVQTLEDKVAIKIASLLKIYDFPGMNFIAVLSFRLFIARYFTGLPYDERKRFLQKLEDWIDYEEGAWIRWLFQKAGSRGIERAFHKEEFRSNLRRQ